MIGSVIWQVRRIDKAGVMDPHRRWLVGCPRGKRWSNSQEEVAQEIAYVKDMIRRYFDDVEGGEPLEDENWSLDVEIVEFEFGGQVAVL